ncbi:MAG: tetraacyldisaccharide 4'-kinase [Phycisphaerae bacterium]|nr:tetraacyldisaccharide 4'-kinase [Phycisphaerae bacterium]
MNIIDIMSGQSKGFGPSITRILLRCGTGLYSFITSLRNFMYDKGLLKSYKLDVPVICVGNITAGGTGKTPMVVWLCKYLQSQSLKVALLTRGYRSQNTVSDDNEDIYDANDEVQMLQAMLEDVAIIVNPDRVAGGRTAIDEHKADIIVMDDGFQHRRLKRDLDIVMIDCLNPFGYNKLLPAGLLRESLKGLKRAGLIVLSRCDLIDGTEKARILQKMTDFTEKAPVLAKHSPSSLLDIQGQKHHLNDLINAKIVAFCGIGNPHGFVGTLHKLGANVIAQHFFDDHTQYDESKVLKVQELAEKNEAELILTTEKDWVKLENVQATQNLKNLRRLQIELSLGEYEVVVKDIIRKVLD